jgi:hypothetical protein
MLEHTFSGLRSRNMEVYYRTTRTKKADKNKKWFVMYASTWSSDVSIAPVPYEEYNAKSWRERIGIRIYVKRQSLYLRGIKHILEAEGVV